MTVPKRALTVASIVALVVSIAPSALAQGGPGGIHLARVARPYVMLALDTSGSMEWRNATFAPDENRVPVCDPIAGRYEKSRWLTAVEVLTGTFLDYRCEYQDRPAEEAGYYIPHVAVVRDADGRVRQRADGIMDIYEEEVEFGLMTMDSYGSALPTAEGMYSWPEGLDALADRHVTRVIDGENTQGIWWTKLGSPSCQYFWNVGARRPRHDGEDFPGAMIPHDFVPDGATDPIYRSRNAYIQEELLKVRPYWSSPVAAMLADARYYYEQYPGVGDSDDGDCYFECRDRHVVLVTDGIPNTDGRPECAFAIKGVPGRGEGFEGVCPYPQAYEEALALYNAGVQVHVIGYRQVDDSAEVLDEHGNVVDTVNEIWRIGTYGWGGNEADCPTDEDGDPECALYADNADELRMAFSRIFDRIIEGTTSHTRTATINTVVSDQLGQHQIFSSMEVSVGGTWEGNLERVSYRCEPVDGEWEFNRYGDVFDFGDDGLDSLTIPRGEYGVRHLYTVDPDSDIRPAAGAAPNDFVPLDDADLTPENYNVATGAERAEILDWMHGATGTLRQTRRLGAIYHSTPAIVGPPTMELPLTSYNVGPHESVGASHNIGFRQLYARRENIIYAASMDGILHAFDLDADESHPTGGELWGFVPPMLLGSLDNQRRGQMFLLDGQILLRDIRFWKDEAATDTDEWATVLVMGLRHGGGVRGYFALDVTAPYDGAAAPHAPSNAGSGSLGEPDDPPYGTPRLLWQITNETPANPYPAYEALDSFAGLGQTYGRPTFGTVMIADPEHSNSLGEVSVTILPAGKRPSGEDNLAVGCGLFIVNSASGRLIRWLRPDDVCNVNGDGDAECDYDTSTFDCQFVGTPMALGGVPGEVTTRIFVGDSRGTMWRADLSNPNPRMWTLDPFFSLFEPDDPEPQPIMEAPAAARDHRGLVTLVFGSGNPDDLESRPINRMVSITEMFDLGNNAIVDGHTCHATWDDVYHRNGWGSEFSRPAFCTGGDERVYPWVNWMFEMSDSEVLPTANLNGAVDGDNAPFVDGERLMGSPVIFDETAYFTTFVPSSDESNCCMPGHGRILAVHYIGDNSTDVTDTDDVYRSLEDDTQSIEVARMEDNQIAYGLAIVRRPSCVEIELEEDCRDTPDTCPYRPNTETSGQAEYDIIVHNNSDNGDPADGEPAPPETGFEQIRLPSPPLRCQPDTWVSIFGV